ncbi:MAG TPA: hypothetical protein VFH51_11140 [Myxococcota bacterium]|nr:hypothetical protein [Myxococcota bacterium]
MAYSGRERRQRQEVLTQNSEYHLRGDTCVAVRCPRTGRLKTEHQAVGSHVLGQVEFAADGSWALQVGRRPEAGTRLFFSSQLVTSLVMFVTRAGEYTLTEVSPTSRRAPKPA